MFSGVKCFSATMYNDRQVLGERVTAWMQANPHAQLIDIVTTQSSDSAFHCITITVFYSEQQKARARP